MENYEEGSVEDILETVELRATMSERAMNSKAAMVIYMNDKGELCSSYDTTNLNPMERAGFLAMANKEACAIFSQSNNEEDMC